ncbi:MAG: Gfo/Idh/MocA family oxidoreductase [Thermoflavifilum sp.]|uniref:Gfo/Idh/MocA family oxidoreductase n=1 Tax=Thermoflavifilum sp. TaxID=1968839 RepID=UPI0018A4AE00|nr:Gfo/Idh/MocA family oxidoreductase [Thermoflavifilum sp.]QOR76241.1 MAG: Gfo/Idh/MocA family oxidoreductase [Thermoflavifilum sp.]
MESRRKFLTQLGTVIGLMSGAGWWHRLSAQSVRMHPLSIPGLDAGGERVRVATVGMGIMGFQDTHSVVKVPGVELVGVADLYDGRLRRAKEVFGDRIITTRDYRELIARNDVDAVMIATADLWHNTVAIDALKAGKAVYCEKPMVQHLDQGAGVISAQQQTGHPLQVGSQRVSSVLYAQAKKLYEAGEIGELNLVRAYIDRHDALGAWQYSIPPDASPQTIDFDTFLKDTPKVPFDPVRFFRWRNYRAYGTGIPGDLFVHLLSGLHFITGAYGPERIFATGELSYWKDGRDVPDLMVAVMDYPARSGHHPAFRVMLEVNFADGSGGGSATRLIGTEGVIEITDRTCTLRRQPLPEAPGYGGWDSFGTFPEDVQQAFVAAYDRQYPPQTRIAPPAEEIVFTAPDGYDDHQAHVQHFIDAVRGKVSVVEDAVFGFRAAAPALACNLSYEQQKPVRWDAERMQVMA